tara:strand:- start:86 stop:757 length:672 start_codon:yes stop_codon:yes gene_type:complete
MKNVFVIGDIVTLKSHPLLEDEFIKGDGKLVPPLMLVTEIFIEDKKKRTHSEVLGKKIADKIKYVCIFFDDNRTEFKKVTIYESMLSEFPERKKDDKKQKIPTSEKYLKDYVFGNNVNFKTNLLELSKQRKSKKTDERKNLKAKGKVDPISISEVTTTLNVVNFSSPKFVLCGIKKNEITNDFYPNGEERKVVSKILYKVKWFNSNQMKFSEEFLPAECFIDI